MTKNKILEEIGFSGILVLLFALILLQLNQWIAGVSISMAVEVGPKFFPKWTAIIGLCLSTTLIITQIPNFRKIVRAKEEGKEADSIGLLIKIVVLFILAVYFMNKIGFIMTSFALLIGAQLILGQKNFKVMVIFSVSVFVLVYIFFIRLLSIAFPRGVGIFYEFSRFFY